MLLHQFKTYISTQRLFLPENKLLLAVSGGVDSVVLCQLCRQAGYQFVMAHCNFQLRGEESERDEAFVKKLGSEWGVPVWVKRFDTQKIAATQKKSIETTARELRYAWFTELLNQQDKEVECILTAHHADDNIETVTMNFFRGTGIAGIRGIVPRQGKLIRPLLFARRKELEDFAKEHQLSFVTDSTNLENDYTRNFFRNTILPQVATVYPEALNNVLQNIIRFTETEILYQQAMDRHKKKLLEKKGNEYHIPVLKLLKTEPLQTVLYGIIKEFGFTAHQVTDAMALLKSETGKYIQSPAWRIIRNRNWLIITALETTTAQHVLMQAGEESILFEAGTIKINRTTLGEHRVKQNPLLAQLDINDIEFPLLLRKWKEGDYFYPLGMDKKKKLSRFFIDKKLSLPEKENVWVVEMNKKIIWVVGMRIDNRYKITATTQQLLLLEWIRK